MSRYARASKHFEYVASDGNGRHSKPTTNKLAAQSTAKRWGGFVFRDTYTVNEVGDQVFAKRQKV